MAVHGEVYNENFVQWIMGVEEEKREFLMKDVLVNQCEELGFTQKLAETALYQITSAILNVELKQLTTEIIESYKSSSKPSLSQRKQTRSPSPLEDHIKHKSREIEKYLSKREEHQSYKTQHKEKKISRVPSEKKQTFQTDRKLKKSHNSSSKNQQNNQSKLTVKGSLHSDKYNKKQTNRKNENFKQTALSVLKVKDKTDRSFTSCGLFLTDYSNKKLKEKLLINSTSGKRKSDQLNIKVETKKSHKRNHSSGQTEQKSKENLFSITNKKAKTGQLDVKEKDKSQRSKSEQPHPNQTNHKADEKLHSSLSRKLKINQSEKREKENSRVNTSEKSQLPLLDDNSRDEFHNKTSKEQQTEGLKPKIMSISHNITSNKKQKTDHKDQNVNSDIRINGKAIPNGHLDVCKKTDKLRTTCVSQETSYCNSKNKLLNGVSEQLKVDTIDHELNLASRSDKKSDTYRRQIGPGSSKCDQLMKATTSVVQQVHKVNTTVHESRKITGKKPEQVIRCRDKSKSKVVKCSSPTPSEMDRQWEERGLTPPRKKASVMWKVPDLPCINLFLETEKTQKNLQPQQSMLATNSESEVQPSHQAVKPIEHLFHDLQQPTLGFPSLQISARMQNTAETMLSVSSSTVNPESSGTAQSTGVPVKGELASKFINLEHKIKVEEFESVDSAFVVKTESQSDSFMACSDSEGDKESIKIPVHRSVSKEMSGPTDPNEHNDVLLCLVPQVKEEIL